MPNRDTKGRKKADETQIAMLPVLPAVWAATMLAARFGPHAARAFQRLKGPARRALNLEKAMRRNNSTPEPTRRTDIAPPSPPLPGYEPPKEKDKIPNVLDYPIMPPKDSNKIETFPTKIEPQIEIYPELDEESKNSGQIIESKGNSITKAELDGIRDYYLGLGWKHIAGGRDKVTGKEIREYWVGGPGNAFPRESSKTGKGDGRQGGKRTDLTFRKPDGTIVHIQSVDVDKNGKPTQREQDNAYKIWLRTNGHEVVLHPKQSQMKRRKPQ